MIVFIHVVSFFLSFTFTLSHTTCKLSMFVTNILSVKVYLVQAGIHFYSTPSTEGVKLWLVTGGLGWVWVVMGC